MLEILVTLIITVLGLLGLAGLIAHAQQAEFESYQRAQALVLLSDISNRVNANRKAAGCYAISDPGTGAPFLGSDSSALPACGTFGDLEQRARAEADLEEIDEVLKGSAELKGGAAAGAMIGARACVSMDTSGTPSVYRVSIAWQGLSPTINPETVDPNLTCARGLYGDERLRRVVSVTFPMARLN